MNIRFLVIAALQGLLLTFFYYALKNNDFFDGLPLSLISVGVTLSIVLPISFFLTENDTILKPIQRTLLLLEMALISGGIALYHGYTQYYSQQLVVTHVILPGFVLFFCLQALLTANNNFGQNRSYSAYFSVAWNNAISFILAIAILAVAWIVLITAAELFKQIDIYFLSNLFQEAYFYIPFSCFVISISFAYSATQKIAIESLQRFILVAQKWLYPLLMLFNVVWAIMFLLFISSALVQQQTLGILQSKGFLLLWVTALAIHLLNCAYQEGRDPRPYPFNINNWLSYAWLSIPVIAGLALYCVVVRILQYGWTLDRIWAFVIAVMAAIYAMGYLPSVFMKRNYWMWSVSKTNVYSAYVLCFILLILLTPVLNPLVLSVNSQLNRLYSGDIAADEFDYNYLNRYKSGNYGKQQLLKLVDGIDHPQSKQISVLASQVLNQTTEPTAAQEAELYDIFLKNLEIYGDFETEQEAKTNILKLFQFLKDSYRYTLLNCLKKDYQCLIWAVDLNNNGDKELLFIYQSSSMYWVNRIMALQQQDDKLVRIGEYELGHRLEETEDDLIKLIKNNKVEFVEPVNWLNLKVNNKKFRFKQKK